LLGSQPTPVWLAGLVCLPWPRRSFNLQFLSPNSPRHTHAVAPKRRFEASRYRFNYLDSPCLRPVWLRKKIRTVGRGSGSVPRIPSRPTSINPSLTASDKTGEQSLCRDRATRKLLQSRRRGGARFASPPPTPLPTPSPVTSLQPRLTRWGRHYANLSQATLPLGILLALSLKTRGNNKKAARVPVLAYESPIASNRAVTLAVLRSG
jgi:hypothetical protein